MTSLNRVLMIGNLTRDPDLRYTPGGSPVATLGLAVNSRYTVGDEKKEETLFIDVNVWDKVAENCCTFLKKGAPVFIEGRLRCRTWDDKETGQKRSKMEITASAVQFLPRGNGTNKPGEAAAEVPPHDDDVPF